jgi:DNA mismatch repair protein MutL
MRRAFRMMAQRIQILPDHVVDKIAAGEVVERPASVVKELIENATDAGASEISVDIEQAGKRMIRVTDNGCGMSREDARTAFLRHATSKIASDADLEAVRTMGFRGEALSSIASVSRVRLLTAVKGAVSGVLILLEAGVVKAVSDAAAPQGASLEINDLFYNTPARLKFLKSPATEFSHIVTAVSRQAMARPDVRFRLTHNRKSVLDLPPATGIKERVFQLYGGEIADNVREFSGGRDGVLVHGLLCRPGYSRADRTYQDFYVNRRAVRNASLTHALYGAYAGMLMRDRHPACFIFLELDPALVDVNVHPAKAEVRFRNQSQIHDLVRDEIREGVRRETTETSEARAEGVRDALAEYLTDRSSGGRGPEAGKNVFVPAPWNAGGGAAAADEGRHSLPLDSSGSRLPRTGGPPEQELYPLAQVHDSFIIAQSREGMAIIDQHAAHERVLFEKLQDQYASSRIELQYLLIPERVELGPSQSGLLADYLPELERFGLLVEDFGNGAFVIKAVPSLLAGADRKKLVLDILDEVNVHGKSGKMEELRDELLSVMACHPAIKMHRRLERREMETIVGELFRCRMPYTCPHGRPTVIWHSIDELKKMFKRT